MSIFSKIARAGSNFVSKAGDLLRGQDPNDVKLPPEVAAAQARRSALAEMIMSRASAAPQVRNEATTAARAAAQQAGATAQGRLQNALNSQVAAARGLGALGARRRAMNQVALGSADIAAGVADANAQSAAAAAAQDVAASQRDEQQRLAELGLVADVTQQEEQAALAADAYRRANARKGFVSTAGAIAGGLIGQKFGGPAGGQAGASAGYEAGRLFERN